MEGAYFGPMMKKICEEIDRRANVETKKYNLTLTQARVLLFLLQKKDRTATQKELEDFLQVSHPTTVTIVKSMETKKIVQTSFDDEDRRMKKVALVWGNEKIYHDLEENAKNMERSLLDGFSDEERTQFYTFLSRAHQNMTK